MHWKVFQGLTALASLKHVKSLAGIPYEYLVFQGLTALASLKLLKSQQIFNLVIVFQGLTALASLKPCPFH